MRFGFFLREALRGLRRSSAPALAALLTVLLTALVLGVFIPIVQATTGTANEVRGRVVLDVYISNDANPAERSELQRTLEGELMCTCGGCRLTVGNCGMMNCHGKESQQAKIKAHIDSGKDHDAIIKAFIDEFGGQDILAAPVDQGFNRLAWLFPYMAGGVGLVTIVLMARRWSRTAPAHAVAGDAGLDAEVNERLDDELRNLD
jgi:cytochrome c-type biogenesis protein CcmH/NrfF